MEKSPLTHRRLIVKFGVRFMGSCVVLYTLINWLPFSWVHHINTGTAAMLGIFLKHLGINPTIENVIVRADGFSVKIITECSAIFVVILFFSFVFAYPSTYKQKWVGLILGIPAVYCFNLLRLVFVFGLGVLNPTLFHYAHVYLGQIVMILLVLTASLIWLKYTTKIRTTDTPLDFFIRFTVFSAISFLLWLGCHRGYVWGHYYIIKLLLGLFNYKLMIPEKIKIVQTFDTFNLVAFSALVLATRFIGKREKVKAFILGIIMLTTVHFFFRLSGILYFGYHLQFALKPFVGFIILNQWVLPFVLWLAILRKELFKRKGIYVCPICGKEKKGILRHIQAKHGMAALKCEKVRPLLAEIGINGHFSV